MSSHHDSTARSLITDPADQPGGWYIREEEREVEPALSKPERYAAALAILRTAKKLLDHGASLADAMVIAGIVDTPLDTLERAREAGVSEALLASSPAFLAEGQIRQAARADRKIKARLFVRVEPQAEHVADAIGWMEENAWRWQEDGNAFPEGTEL